MADKFTRRLKMTQSAGQQQGEEEERMRRRKECPISFSPA